MDPLVYIIVLNWNGIEHLPVCLGSLQKLAYSNKKILMVDNNSTDGSQDFVRREFPGVEIIRNRKNIGFSPANNVGMRCALERNADYISLLNNDMEVDSGWITELVAAAENDRTIGACATKMLYFYNRDIIQGIGICLNRIALAWDYLNGRYDLEDIKIDGEVLGSCGGAFFARADVLRKTGLFDPAYFTYYEDVELSMRIWDEGYRIVTVPSARVYHKFAATMVENSRWKNYLILRNRLRLILKCFPAPMLRRALFDTLRWELKVGRDNYWKKDYAMIANQVRAIFTATLRALSTVSHRRRTGPIESKRLWGLVKREPTPYRVRLPQPPYRKWDTPKSSVVRPAVNSSQLGPGWYLMYNEGDNRFRWFAKEASLSLRVPQKEGCSLRIAVGNDYHNLKKIELIITINGKEIGQLIPEKGWNTYRLPLCEAVGASILVKLLAGDLYNADVTGELTDLSFKVKEVALEPGAPCRSRIGR